MKYPKVSVGRKNKSILIEFKKGKTVESQGIRIESFYFIFGKDKNGEITALEILEW